VSLQYDAIVPMRLLDMQLSQSMINIISKPNKEFK